LKLFQELGVRGMNDNGGGVNSSIMYLIHCKNLCKCHSVPIPSIIIKEKNKKEKSEHFIHCILVAKSPRNSQALDGMKLFSHREETE
jgi:hypothetical protein